MNQQRSFEDVHREFLAIETEYGLFDIRVDGVPVWERVRFDHHQRLLREADVFPDSDDAGTLTSREYLAGIKRWVTNLVNKNPFFADQTDLLFLGAPRRKRQPDCYWWDIYCDPLYDALKLEYLHLEESGEGGHRRPAKTERMRYLDIVEYTGTLLRKLGLVRVSLPPNARERLESVEEAFTIRFGVELDVTGRVEYKLARRRAVKWLYDKLLERIDPELAVVVVSYGRETFVEACQGQGIPVVELQHGVVHEYHYAYHFPGERGKEAFPDYFFSFGEFWNERVSFPIPEERVVPVGYPYLDSQAMSYSNVETQDQIIFISQQSIGEVLSKIAVSVAENTEHDVIYKLHPKEYGNWTTIYPHLQDAPLEIIKGDDPPLYQLFAESSVQVGVGSTALYEGLQFGLATYIFDLPSAQYLQPLVDAGYATSVERADDLVNAIDTSIQRRVDTSRVFKNDAIQNFDQALVYVRNHEPG